MNIEKSSKEKWTNGDLNPGPFTIAQVRSENHTPRPFARQYYMDRRYQISIIQIYLIVPLKLEFLNHSFKYVFAKVMNLFFDERPGPYIPGTDFFPGSRFPSAK